MEPEAEGKLIVDRKYLRNQLQTSTMQLNLKYLLQAMVEERLQYYAALDYDILASYIPANQFVKADNSFLARLKVLRSDPLVHNEIPTIGINKIQDTEAEQYIGELDNEFQDDMGKWHRQEGSMWTESVELRVWSHNADERDYIGHILKYILFELRPILADLGVINQSITGGQDESDPASYDRPMFWVSYIYTGTLNLFTSRPATDSIVGFSLCQVDENGNLIEGRPGITYQDLDIEVHHDC